MCYYFAKMQHCQKTCFYIRRCTRGVHALLFPFALRTSVMRTSVEMCVPDATTAAFSHTVWFKGKRGHYAQLHDKLSGQRSMYLTLNSATDYCENASQWYRFKRAPCVFFPFSLLSFTIGLPQSVGLKALVAKVRKCAAR